MNEIEKQSVGSFIKENWAQVTFVIYVVFQGAVSYSQFNTLKTQVSDNKEFTVEVVKYLNGEDDGVRADFETSDRFIKEREELRERALKAELLLEIEKIKK